MAILQALKGLNPGQVFPLEGESIILGRHPDCDVVLEVGAVSRQHARITKADGAFYVEDLHSRNGTFVNEEAVETPRKLVENDEVRICDLVFVFHLGPADDLQQPPVGDDSTETRALLVDDDQVTTGSTIMSKLDVSTGREGLRLTVNPEAKLKALLEIGQNLGRALSQDDVLAKVLDSLFKIFLQADRGYIVLRDPATGHLVPRALKHRREEGAEQVRISRTIINGVMSSKEAILSADAATDSRFEMSESIADFQIHSMMCAPLVGTEGNVLGVLQIDTTDQRNRFAREDLEVLASVAAQAAVSVENAQLHEVAVQEQVLMRELALAHKVQQGFLPAAPPELAGYEFFDYYEPANHLGGDYFDYIPLRDGRLAITLADVSGKGIAAALLMAKLSAETRYCLASEASPAAAVARLNNVFCESRWEDRFVTLSLTVLDPTRHEVTVVSAGHMAPLLRRTSGDIEAVGEAAGGLPLGVQCDTEYAETPVSLSSGDAVVIYSDGVPDAMNPTGEFYSTERLLTQLARSDPGVDAIGQGILGDVRRFVSTRTQNDDMCLTCYGRVG